VNYFSSRLPAIVPFVCLWVEKEIGRREIQKGKGFLVCRVGIRLEFRKKLKSLKLNQ
jgi:hypothetical protein